MSTGAKDWRRKPLTILATALPMSCQIADLFRPVPGRGHAVKNGHSDSSNEVLAGTAERQIEPVGKITSHRFTGLEYFGRKSGASRQAFS
jgi:hypothetical protein